MATSRAVELKNITKRYPRVTACDSVNLSVREGEIHAIVGENGAGKSTLMKLLYGLVRPDSGEIHIRDKRLRGHSPHNAIRLGIGMVHQHFMLVGPLTVAENVVLGQEPVRGGCFVDTRRAREMVQRLSDEYGLELDPDARVEDLSVGLEQRVEIVKVLFRGADILILDEPTGVLTPHEVADLFFTLRLLKKSGRTIIFITHKLDEVLELADRVTVMRGGRITGEVKASVTSKRELARMMVGRDVLLEVDRGESSPGDPVLEVSELSAAGLKGTHALDAVDFLVRSGEVLGIAGVHGNGQTELVEVLTGLRRPDAGSVRLCGEEIVGRSPRVVRDLGVAHVPEDRQERGLVLDFSLAENLVLGRHHQSPFSVRGLIGTKAVRSHAEGLIESHDIRPADHAASASSLSGGNQQKLIVAREFDGSPALLIAAQPTRGVDIGAIEFVHKSLISMRDAGAAVLLISAELSEIMTLSDRIVVMYGGRIVAEFEADTVTEEELGMHMTGAAS
ncbi:ABC transporter ATP-binding protein [bacterium]|nr:ABC transporter ATP-binding protein [bacterium]